jgi:hypothetical protein
VKRIKIHIIASVLALLTVSGVAAYAPGATRPGGGPHVIVFDGNN